MATASGTIVTVPTDADELARQFKTNLPENLRIMLPGPYLDHLKKTIEEGKKVLIVPDDHPLLKFIPSDYSMIVDGEIYRSMLVFCPDYTGYFSAGSDGIYKNKELDVIYPLAEFVCHKQDIYFQLWKMLGGMKHGEGSKYYSDVSKRWLCIPQIAMEKIRFL